MKPDDHKLDKLLQRLRVPDRSDGYWESFPQRVTRLARERTSAPSGDTVRGLYWWLAMGAACLVLGIGIVVWRSSSASLSSSDRELARSEKLYREIAALFPGRVQAIIVDGREVKLALSDNADVPASTPLFVKICGGERCRAFVTFSGQRIQVNGEMLDVLADAHGNVIVTGRHFAWSSALPEGAAGSYRIQAQALGVRS